MFRVNFHNSKESCDDSIHLTSKVTGGAGVTAALLSVVASILF